MTTVRSARAKSLLRRIAPIVDKFVEAAEGAAGDFGVVEQATALAFDSLRGVFVTEGLTAAAEKAPTFHCPD